MDETQSSEEVSTKLRRIAEAARADPKRVLTCLAHHIDIEFLREAYRRTRKDGSTGVDGQTAGDFAAALDKNLEDLLNGFKSGTYRAPAVRRAYIPKGDGKKTRPLGIPTFADKVLQRAVNMVLTAVYEQDFHTCSYGFRPGRSQKQALHALREGIMEMRGGWILEVDIKAYFDTLDHSKLREILDLRVRDGVLRKMIDKWLKAGVLEDGALSYPEAGTPQGGVISPLLANVYLHTVLDTWFHQEVQPRLRGRGFLVRFADDFVMVFSDEADARRAHEELPNRFQSFGLTVHPDKTRLVPFDRPPFSSGGKGRDADGNGPGTFDFLGFNFRWARSRRDFWVVKLKTAKSRLKRALRAIAQWCRSNRHLSIPEQHEALVAKVRGHYEYYGVTSNNTALNRYIWWTERIWKRWLERRSQRGLLNWGKFKKILRLYPLPRPWTRPLLGT